MAVFSQTRWQFWIDVGGTFTDCVAQAPDGTHRQWKTLSSGVVKGLVGEHSADTELHDLERSADPENIWSGWTFTLPGRHPTSDWTAVVRASADGVLTLDRPLPADASGRSYELHCDEDAPLICIRRLLGLRLDQPIPDVDVRLGTTRGTNALLERRGARTALVITKGFADVLRIGNQDRPDLFALNILKPQPLTERVVEVHERIDADGRLITPLDEPSARAALEQLREEGIESLAICLLHGYRNSKHERRLEIQAQKIGFENVSRSSAVAPLIKLVPRAETTVLDAYLTPILRRYVEGIRARLGAGSHMKLMTSLGGLIDGAEFSGKDSILSGPAGGIVASAAIASAAGHSQSIGFDMGGTSTDVSRFDGAFELESESVKAGVRIAGSVLAIETVAAGGGSICQFDGVQLRVGPESAGADPGPACYGRGGPFTVTDANVVLGRVLPDRFPFPLDRKGLDARLSELVDRVASGPSRQRYGKEELAQGLIEVANETMAQAIRTISTRKGYDPAEHLLVCFGGAGGQHACALARSLGIRSILVHPYAGVLSAYGMGLADVRRRTEQSVMQPLNSQTLSELETTFCEWESRLKNEVLAEGIPASEIQSAQRSLALRYVGVESTILVSLPQDGDYARAYEAQHLRQFGYQHTGRPIEIVSLAVEVTGHLPSTQLPRLAERVAPLQPVGMTRTWFDRGWNETPVFEREQLCLHDRLSGPAIICDAGSTVWIEPGFTASVKTGGELLIEAHNVPATDRVLARSSTDPISLEIFNSQFASIAAQMGVTLRKTSISTNVKERLDYSCALFDSNGGLVVNAPHIPVHLGAMAETVQALLSSNLQIAPGDVFLTNDPYSGGSHLPDLTVITPVHCPASGELWFLTASRAHHAEIGGITPGSMPPFSKTLGEEGVLIRDFRIVQRGQPRWEEFRKLLTSGGWPSRKPDDNLADVAAQVAANRIGGDLLLELVDQTSIDAVRQSMQAIQDAAEAKLRRALERFEGKTFKRRDHLDDGSPIAVCITVRDGGATVDFTGTGPVLSTNLNANRAIVTAAVMYVFRCLIDEPIPLNSGLLKPIKIVLPECLLNPPANENRESCAAMVGGNVETSQRIVDVLLGALELAAASQGTMNNLTFGDETFGYYETIAGGSGATAHSQGADAVHTHMTNTRLTDAEVLESRYPVRVEEFSIRRGSGGAGEHRGGDGVRRVFRFLKPLDVSLLSQRRGPYPPFGLAGGEPGALGQQHIVTSDGAFSPVPGMTGLKVNSGEQLVIETPGGGGYGVEQRP